MGAPRLLSLASVLGCSRSWQRWHPGPCHNAGRRSRRCYWADGRPGRGFVASSALAPVEQADSTSAPGASRRPALATETPAGSVARPAYPADSILPKASWIGASHRGLPERATATARTRRRPPRRPYLPSAAAQASPAGRWGAGSTSPSEQPGRQRFWRHRCPCAPAPSFDCRSQTTAPDRRVTEDWTQVAWKAASHQRHLGNIVLAPLLCSIFPFPPDSTRPTPDSTAGSRFRSLLIITRERGSRPAWRRLVCPLGFHLLLRSRRS